MQEANGVQRREATMALAVVDIYVLDFVINIGMRHFGLLSADC